MVTNVYRELNCPSEFETVLKHVCSLGHSVICDYYFRFNNCLMDLYQRDSLFHCFRLVMIVNKYTRLSHYNKQESMHVKVSCNHKLKELVDLSLGHTVNWLFSKLNLRYSYFFAIAYLNQIAVRRPYVLLIYAARKMFCHRSYSVT